VTCGHQSARGTSYSTWPLTRLRKRLATGESVTQRGELMKQLRGGIHQRERGVRLRLGDLLRCRRSVFGRTFRPKGAEAQKRQRPVLTVAVAVIIRKQPSYVRRSPAALRAS
jgi:hypothetical protein